MHVIRLKLELELYINTINSWTLDSIQKNKKCKHKYMSRPHTVNSVCEILAENNINQSTLNLKLR